MKELAILKFFAVWLILSAALILFSGPAQAYIYDDFTSMGINTSLWNDMGPNTGLFSQPGDGNLYYSDNGSKKDNLVSSNPVRGAFFVSMQYSNFYGTNNQPPDLFLSSGPQLTLSDGTNSVSVHESVNIAGLYFVAGYTIGGVHDHAWIGPVYVNSGWLGIRYNGILGTRGQVTLWYKAGAASTEWTQIAAWAPKFSQNPYFLIVGNDKDGTSLSFRVNQVQLTPTPLSPIGALMLLLD
jgi:hypothetical protein